MNKTIAILLTAALMAGSCSQERKQAAAVQEPPHLEKRGGVTQLMALVAARRLGSVPFGYWIMPSLILLTGLFVILKPMESAELPLLILGWCSILYGVVELINALKIHRLRKEADDALAIQQETQAEEIESHIGNDALDVSSEDVDTGLVVPTRRDD